MKVEWRKRRKKEVDNGSFYWIFHFGKVTIAQYVDDDFITLDGNIWLEDSVDYVADIEYPKPPIDASIKLVMGP